MEWGGVFIYIKSLGGVYNTRTKLNPGAALEEPEHQGIRSINEQQQQQPWEASLTENIPA